MTYTIQLLNYLQQTTYLYFLKICLFIFTCMCTFVYVCSYMRIILTKRSLTYIICRQLNQFYPNLHCKNNRFNLCLSNSKNTRDCNCDLLRNLCKCSFQNAQYLIRVCDWCELLRTKQSLQNIRIKNAFYLIRFGDVWCIFAELSLSLNYAHFINIKRLSNIVKCIHMFNAYIQSNKQLDKAASIRTFTYVTLQQKNICA
eukprot:TRINITY_DN199_c0_g1_i6.p7 TRINITY_DN199_c0_g1~~TRINITY_DN199_c0_g1_i6.p7  ORF type:complete len:200 (-),score=-11.86 TRINITY_DN199_c0_g1_i6:800-1399(-)